MFTKAIALALAAATAVQADWGHPAGNRTVTEVVNIWSTFCPEPTHLTMNNRTYTVTEACTFTITDCPCTITKTVPTNPPAPPKQNTPAAPANQPAVPTAAPGAPAVVAGAGQNAASYGMALAGAIAAAAVAL